MLELEKKGGGEMKQSLSILAVLLMVSVITFFGALHIQGVANAIIPGLNDRISMRSTGAQINGAGSSGGLISPNGKFATFSSNATTVLPSGGKGSFLKNLTTGSITRLNMSTAGVVSSGDVSVADVSTTGRFVLFISNSTNLIDGTTIASTHYQLYLRDTVLLTTELISKNSTGQASNSGVSPAGVSSDGRFVSFSSAATNMHSDATDGLMHLYVVDRSSGAISVLDRKQDGSLGSSYVALEAEMSCDGSLIAFTYGNNMFDPPYSNHIDVYLLDLRNGNKITNLTRSANGVAVGPTISCNGDYVGFKTTANNLDSSVATNLGWYRPYVYDRVTEKFHYVALTSAGSVTNTHVCGTYAGGACVRVSDYGLAVFNSSDSAIAGSSISQVYIRDLNSNISELLSRDSAGSAADNAAAGLSITSDGSMVTYSSGATNLVAGDTNGYHDAFRSATGY